MNVAYFGGIAFVHILQISFYIYSICYFHAVYSQALKELGLLHNDYKYRKAKKEFKDLKIFFYCIIALLFFKGLIQIIQVLFFSFDTVN